MKDNTPTLITETPPMVSSNQPDSTPELKTIKVTSPAFTMTQEQWDEFMHGLFKYLSIPATAYLLGVVSQTGFDGFQLKDLIPTQFFLDSFVTYTASQLLSFLSKYLPEKREVIS